MGVHSSMHSTEPPGHVVASVYKIIDQPTLDKEVGEKEAYGGTPPHEHTQLRLAGHDFPRLIGRLERKKHLEEHRLTGTRSFASHEMISRSVVSNRKFRKARYSNGIQATLMTNPISWRIILIYSMILPSPSKRPGVFSKKANFGCELRNSEIIPMNVDPELPSPFSNHLII